jgi:hypothetical protein
MELDVFQMMVDVCNRRLIIPTIKKKFIVKYLVIPVGDKEYLSPTNVCDLCRCEGDQAFVCDSRCDIITESSNCTEAELVENNDSLCPCLVCPEQKGMLKIIFCHRI